MGMALELTSRDKKINAGDDLAEIRKLLEAEMIADGYVHEQIYQELYNDKGEKFAAISGLKGDYRN